jgi:glyoxalase family protein
VPLEYAITGLGPVFVRISNFDALKAMLEKAMLFKEIAQEGLFHLFEMGEGGNGASVIVEENADLPEARQGFGSVHHAAFRVENRSVLEEWIARFNSLRLPNSGYVNRHFFESLYARVAPQILFEVATDGPGFMGDEPYETLGEKLSLPPFLEPKRAAIEKLVRPIDTIRSTKEFIKE